MTDRSAPFHLEGDIVRCMTQYHRCLCLLPGLLCWWLLFEAVSEMYSANSCVACSNPDVKYYEDGSCKADKVFCDPKVRPEVCTREYSPVCAYSTDSKGKHTVVSTAGNACSACSNPDVDYFMQGECPAPPKPVVKSTQCDAKNRPEMCTMIYDPVCATLSKCPKGQKSCTQTFGSGCSACSNTNVLSYVSGECKN